jgi:GNAT superfamily N-acetyltransferase
MPDATLFARQWAGLVAHVRLFGAHGPGASGIEEDGMVAAIMPTAPTSSLMNVALTEDPAAPPRNLAELAERYRAASTAKWGLWLDAANREGAEAAQAQGMVLDSRPTAMVADLDTLPIDDEPPPCARVDLATVGRVNDLAYGYSEPKLAPAIAALPPTALQTYGITLQDETACVATAFDVGDDTAVWFVATLPHAQRNGLAAGILRRLLLDARERGQRTASLQASQKGRALYERLGFRPVGSLHLYEERFS